MSINERIEQRLNDLDDLLKLYYEKLKYYQMERGMAEGIGAKFAIDKRIEMEILPHIMKFETEYARLLSQEVGDMDISDEDATASTEKIQTAISEIQKKAASSEFIKIVSDKEKGQQLKALVTSVEDAQKVLIEPGKSPQGKLKASLPLLPGIISYELELDAHSVLLDIWKNLKAKFKK